MSEQNKQVVLKFIEAMGSSDGAAAAPCLDPEAFTVAKGFGKFAGIRHYATILGTIDAFKKLVPRACGLSSRPSPPKEIVWRLNGRAMHKPVRASPTATNIAWCSRCATAGSGK